MRVVASITLRSMAHENRRLTIVSTMPPTAPTEAASVGVAMPAKIEPSTAMIRANGRDQRDGHPLDGLAAERRQLLVGNGGSQLRPEPPRMAM